MHQLNNVDNNNYRSNSTFVEFRPHQHDPQSLSRAALRHIPDQLVEYFVGNDVYPKRPNHRTQRSSTTIDSVISDLSIDELM
mmetsp:Transcript_4328/g.5635  ORF Transcript_4328/g.5635 Transcript_4328/m.5635 type:complete len:82 (+) Transcript_4328:293-538(+)